MVRAILPNHLARKISRFIRCSFALQSLHCPPSLSSSLFCRRSLRTSSNTRPSCPRLYTPFPSPTCLYSSGASARMPAPVGAKNGTATSFQRLPKTVIPSNYDLTFEPDWTTHTFQATALIDVDVKEQTDVIILNSSKLSINGPILFTPSPTAEDANPASSEAEIYLLDMEQETLKINFPAPLKTGLGRLQITYSGAVADNLRGFFRSKYRGPTGEDRYNYCTKFEPTYARCCHPAWDEPAIKATYDITLIVPKHLTALSNMPVKEDVPHPSNPDKKIVKFERSVKMSTYLMAFAIGEFDHVECRTPDGILCRVYTPVGKKEQGQYGLDTVVKSLNFYKSYFGIPYPLPKMDLLAISEFGSGAMENWGLVVFLEQRLLMDAKLTSSLAKQFVALVVAHETSHMWFGNLVTMEWWSDLWLNEGFAKFMEYFCVDTIYTELGIWNIFMNGFRQALELDASSSSHPIQVTVGDPGEIGSIFDTISYNKGASVIRMLHNYLGDEIFREGLKLYLGRHLFANAETKDLWQALGEKSGEDIGAMMSTFTEQMGFPIITVTGIEDVNGQKKVTMKYEKFWADAKSKEQLTSGHEKYRWIIPITLIKKSDPKGVALKVLVDKQAGEEFSLCVDAKEGEWVKVNAGSIGYYRVVYPPQVLQNFAEAIKTKEMASVDRLGILDDLFANAKAGNGGSDEVLKFLTAYQEEDSSSVWSGILDILTAVGGLIRGTPLHSNFKSYSQGLLASIATKLGWTPKDNEPPQDSVLRTQILRKLIDFGCPNAVQEARNLFAKHLRGDLEIPPDTRSAVYRAVAHAEGESGFEALLKIYRGTDLKEEKMRVLASMGATTDKAVIDKLLEFGRGKECLMQDIITILYSLSDQGHQDHVWEYFQQHWEFFRDSFPTGHFLIRHTVETVTSGFKTEEKALEIEKFFKDHPIKGIDRTVEQSLEGIRNSKAWLERDNSGLQEFLGGYCT